MSPPARPPRLARFLARAFSAADDRSLLLGDLEERFQEIARRSGTGRARRWYWSQALRGCVAALTPDTDLWARRSWEGLAGDVRQSARVLLRRPIYTVGVVGTLTLGLASAALVFSVAWHVWLAPMPFPDPDRVVRLYELAPPEEGSATDEPTPWRVSPPLLEDFRAHEWEMIDAVSGVSTNVADWVRDDVTTRIRSLVVSPEIFEILGMAPLAGRALSRDEDALEVVLTRDFWGRAFGADPGAVGSSIMLSGRPHRVVGVVDLPAGYPGSADVVTRFSFGPDDLQEGMRGARYLDVVARVAPGRSVQEASAEVDRFVETLGRTYRMHEGWGGRAVSLEDELLRPYRGVLALLLAAGSVFLLLAVVNVAGLVAARRLEGRQERAVRLALGASERRLLRGSVVESGMLGALAAAGALLTASMLMGPMRALIPAEIPRGDTVVLGVGVMAMVVALALAAGWVVGVLGYALSRGTGPSTGRDTRSVVAGSRGRSVIVMCQVALTTLLATAGAGVLRQVVELQGVDLGFDPEGVVSTQVSLTGERYPTPDVRLAFWRDVLDRLEARGLEVAIGTSPPMAGVNMRWGYRVDGASDEAVAQYHIVSPRYFEVMGIEIVEGRPFREDDREGGAAVVVVNEALARASYPDGALGREISVLNQPKTIVGVARDVRHFGPGEDAPPELYAPYGQDPWPHAQILARGEAADAGPVIAAAAAGVDATLGLAPAAPYERFVAQWFAALRLQLVIVGVLAVVGTALATLGLYALVAYRVNARRREIGVRKALGASEARMFSDVVRQGTLLAILGMLLGFAAWYASLPAAGHLLGDVDARDPWVPLGVGLLVGMVSAIASALPARRSVAVDPVVALRAE